MGPASICHYTLSNFEVYGQLLPGLNHFSQVFEIFWKYLLDLSLWRKEGLWLSVGSNHASVRHIYITIWRELSQLGTM